jgi:hypothetical protein
MSFDEAFSTRYNKSKSEVVENRGWLSVSYVILCKPDEGGHGLELASETGWERCPSGLWCRSRKAVSASAERGFESHPLRQNRY